MSSAAITVENVSKAYTVWSSPAARLHGPLLGRLGQLPFLPGGARALCKRLSHDAFRNYYALRDVSLEIRRGASVGILGRNGSGKSTLLQLLAGTLTPTQGDITITGSVAALLELGSGFDAEFTGRENVYLNAAIRGMTRRQTDAKFAEIVAFADIGDFIDQPIKTYSSGMMVRLAFAVSVCLKPEVLLVDEAHSVGDIFFQQEMHPPHAGRNEGRHQSIRDARPSSRAQRDRIRLCAPITARIAFHGSTRDAVILYQDVAQCVR